MMLTLLISGLLTQAAPVAVERTPFNVEVPAVEHVTADPTCGGRVGMSAIATCFATTQAGAATAVDAFDADFTNHGWLAADGSNNRIIYVKRKAEGGCEAFQLLAFAGEGAAAAPAAPAYIALAAIPGDICVASPATSPISAAPLAPQ
ncbi:MAG: hypothetical protein V4701_10695 [Pseudomonadota bacterium]